jgi:hypothetical protein
MSEYEPGSEPPGLSPEAAEPDSGQQAYRSLEALVNHGDIPSPETEATSQPVVEIEATPEHTRVERIKAALNRAKEPAKNVLEAAVLGADELLSDVPKQHLRVKYNDGPLAVATKAGIQGVRAWASHIKAQERQKAA